ncbi:hypothetical protein [Nocardioides sp. Root151]|uniref:hypothetical protein n=1 Tax=Nocardioides sp. Root151 TaxID=1736475 RepID=UPI00070281F1|nr:hypothetical protein [Nocardioides sp. Root151]KQZ70287.1 hypothetical protein ASD66_11645 [Nocardioides sp. Root151]
MSDFERRLSDEVSAAIPSTTPPFDEVVAVRDRRRNRRRGAVAAIAVVAVIGGVFVATGVLQEDPVGNGRTDVASSESPSASATKGSGRTFDPALPLPIILNLAAGDRDLDPWTSCWSGPPDGEGVVTQTCSDGMPPKNPVAAGSPDDVEFTFPADGWTFEATFRPSDAAPCAQSFTVPVEKTGAQTFRIDPVGPAAAWEVDVFGRGPQGDAVATFAWETPTAGTVPPPRSYMSLVEAGDGGEVQAPSSLELVFSGLDRSPGKASVVVTVTAANGNSMQLDTERVIGHECIAEGTLSFSGTRAQARQAARLGPAPFTYAVDLTLDGTTYAGTGTWPTDQRKDEAPYVDLTFDPPLPAYE